MLNIFKFLVTSILLVFFAVAKAQNISSKVYDSKTNQPLTLVNVVWEEGKGVATNENGEFFFILPQKYSYAKTVEFSLIGYQTKVYTIREIKNVPVLYLTPKPMVLKDVVISNAKLTVENVLDSVTKYLPDNHKSEQLKKRKLYLKEKNDSKLTSFDFDLKDSSIEEITPEFIEATLAEMPKETSFVSEILAERYSSGLKKNKLSILKANRLYDVEGDGALEAIFNELEALLNRNVKTDSYYKIKTGLLGFKMQADSTFIKDGQVMDLRNEMGSEDEKENFFLYDRKQILGYVFADNVLNKKSKIEFLEDQNDFIFKLEEGLTIIDDEDVYKINIAADGSNKFNGVLYINAYDYGIMRVDYKNNTKLKSLKFFGVNYNETGYRGSMVFQKQSKTNNYELVYLEKIIDNSFGVDRPFKIIEKNKNVRGRRKQNQLKFNMNMQMSLSTKYQVLVLDINPSTTLEYESVDEKKSIQPKNWKKYKDNFWNGYPKIKDFDNCVKQFSEVQVSY